MSAHRGPETDEWLVGFDGPPRDDAIGADDEVPGSNGEGAPGALPDADRNGESRPSVGGIEARAGRIAAIAERLERLEAAVADAGSVTPGEVGLLGDRLGTAIGARARSVQTWLDGRLEVQSRRLGAQEVASARLGERLDEQGDDLVREAEERERALARIHEAIEELAQAVEGGSATRRRVAELEWRSAGIERRLDSAEHELDGFRAGLRAAAGGAERSAAGPARASEPGPAGEGAPPPRGGLDLNAASFEQLRGLGLSVTQAARLIAYRDAGGGFGSLDELDVVPGFPDALLDEIRPRLRLGARRGP